MHTSRPIAVIGLVAALTMSSETVAAAAAPNDGLIAFTRLYDEGGVFVVEPDGSGLHLLVPEPPAPADADFTRIEDMAWSPDGSRLAFVLRIDVIDSSDVRAQIYLADADGSGSSLLRDDPANVVGLSWSSDGALLYFNRIRHGFATRHHHRGLWAIGVDGTGLVNVNRTPDTQIVAPDDRHVAYSQHARGGADDLFVARLDGSRERRLTSTRGQWEAEPAWSPDSTQLLYRRFGASWSRIMVMNVDGRGERTLILQPRHVGPAEPEWAPSGRKIAYTRYLPAAEDSFNREVIVLRLGTYTETNVTSTPADVEGAPDWQPRPTG